MNYKVLFQKLYVVIIVLLAAVVHLAEPVEVVASSTETSDSVGGAVTTFGFNNPAVISGVQIIDDNDSPIDFHDTNVSEGNVNNALTRMREFTIQFDIEDLDGFDHLDFYIALFNTNNTSEDPSMINTAINSGVSDRSIVFRWFSPERSTFLNSGVTFVPEITSGQDNFLVKSGTSEISVTSGTSSDHSGLADFISTSTFNAGSGTWIIDSGARASSAVIRSGLVNTFSGTTVTSSGVRNLAYRVTIPFTMSKVAPSDGYWHLGVVVHDRLQREINATRTNELVVSGVYAAGAYANQWYGEVAILTEASIFFPNVQAGGNFVTSVPSGLTGVKLSFISNGTFLQQVSTGTTWNPAITGDFTTNFAYLIPNSGFTIAPEPVLLRTEGNRFALEARRTAFNEELSETNFVGIIPVGTNTAVQADWLPASVTDETGAYRLVRENSKASRVSTIADDIAGTSEIGITSRFEFQFRASRVFEGGVYNGTVTIGISNSPNGFGSNE